MERTNIMFDQVEMGIRIRRARMVRKITVEKLADYLMVSVNTIYKWQRGQNAPDIQNLAELSMILHVSLDYLILGIEERTLGGDGEELSPL